MEAVNVGEHALNAIAETWYATAEVRWVEHGFDWTPGSHLIRVRAFQSPLESSQGRWRITVETHVLRDVGSGDTRFIRLLGAMTPFLCSTYAPVYIPENVQGEFEVSDSPLSYFSSTYVSETTVGWLGQFLARAAILQPAFAEQQAQILPNTLGGGQPDMDQDHRRSPPDEVLSVLQTIYIPEGQKPNRWINSDEFASFAEQYARQDICFGFGDPKGMTLETPFGQDSALIRFHTDQAHPQLGNGLLVTLELPFQFEKDAALRLGAELNFLEARLWTDSPQLGCWQIRERGEDQSGLAHSSFIPNALFTKGLVTNFAFWSIGRAQWVRRKMWPDLSDLTMAEILESRYRLHENQ